MIVVKLTPDEFANVQTALEHYSAYLAEYGKSDYGDDLPEIKDSVQRALERIDAAGSAFFARRRLYP